MEYVRVTADDSERVKIVHNILKVCGWNMAKQCLFHWLPPYSCRRIRKDARQKNVFLVWDESLMTYTSTFQMYIADDGNLYSRKIATLPKYEGRGIGKSNLAYIEQFARKKGCPKICLDVYVKSKTAVRFYLINGFKITGKKHSVRFEEYVMEKQIGL